MSRYLFVNEEGLMEYSSQVEKRMQLLNNFISEYLRILESLLKNAAIDGALHDKLQIFYDNATVLVNQPLLLAQECAAKISGFIDELDKADTFIY